MLLKSSSTPVLGSLLSSFSESPASNHHDPNYGIKHPQPSSTHRKLALHPTASLNFSSPISSSTNLSRKPIRRVHSEGNLEGLAHTSRINDQDEFSHPTHPNKSPAPGMPKPRCAVLQTIPSFSFYNSPASREDEYEDQDEYEDEDEEQKQQSDAQAAEQKEQLLDLEPLGNPSQQILRAKGGDVTMEHNSSTTISSSSTHEITVGHTGYSAAAETEILNGQLYLAKGLGIGSGGGIGGSKDNPPCSGGDGGDSHSVEEYYKRMVEQNPGNPLFLRNYAHFLYQIKGDLVRAEEYYSRAILTDPTDGEILSKYAQLVWELYKDQNRASSYFQRAITASSEDSHVHAAYANFLWETDEDEDFPRHLNTLAPTLPQGAVASFST